MGLAWANGGGTDKLHSQHEHGGLKGPVFVPYVSICDQQLAIQLTVSL